MKKFVITGAPGTGKTSILNHLKTKGYNCIDEISREIISEQIAMERYFPGKTFLFFQKEYLN